MNFFIHPSGICESKDVGEDTRIWAFAHVLPSARIGRSCNICNNVFIENDVVIGDRVTIKCGVQLWDGIHVGNDVFIGPNATFTNDRFPRSGHHLSSYPKTKIEDGASIGANATILPGITIGQGAMVGAGSVVTRSVPSHAVVVGNPARIVNYTVASKTTRIKPSPSIETPGPYTDIAGSKGIAVGGCLLIDFPHFKDMRGSLAPIEFNNDLPFQPKRSFLVFSVPSKEVRGEHAHHKCHQLLITLSGSCNVVIDDGRDRAEVNLNTPTSGLYLPPMIWGTQYKFTHDAVLLVFASHSYDPRDYIRTYDTFLEIVGTTN